MINIRFHVVSLVAVFLALGVGVAMGASFIDRATVDSMRGRVDDLETGFRERGGRLDEYRDFLKANDEAAQALTEQGSRASAATLTDNGVVLVVPASGLPDGSVDDLTAVLENAGASVLGRVVIQPAIAETPSGGGAGVQADSPAQRANELAAALAVLSAEPPDVEAPPAPVDPAAPPVDPVLVNEAAARDTIEGFSEAGLIGLDAAGQPAEVAFPETTGVRYLVVVAAAAEPSATDWMIPFVEDYGSESGTTMLVAGVEEAREPGDTPASPEQGEELPAVLEPIRSGAASNEVSSVQFATEPLARLSVVYGMQALVEGIVGHYGLGEGVSVPYPPTAQE
ncbi:MAG: copper transporter [Actinomycetia bacterium]|nr:copper transporter [Actinomycetes bacterium]